MTKNASLRLVAGQDASPEADVIPVPRERRYSVLLNGSIARGFSRNRMPIRVRNISANGLMGECAYPPRVDDLVEIELPRVGLIMGRIRWGGSGRIGIQFDGPIDPTLAFAKLKSEVRLDWKPGDGKRPGVVTAH